jgi:hypothetical protein
MSLGIALIFGGYVWMKRPESRGVEKSRSREEGREVGAAGLPEYQIHRSARSLGETSFAQPGVETPGRPALDPSPIPGGATARDPVNGRRGTKDERPKTDSTLNPGITFIEAQLASLSDEALAEECRVWSVPARDIDAFNRAEARRVWAFRNRLTVEGQAAFDARPAGLRLQLAELYFEVMSPEIVPVDRPLVAPIDRLAMRAEAEAQSARAAGGSVD